MRNNLIFTIYSDKNGIKSLVINARVILLLGILSAITFIALLILFGGKYNELKNARSAYSAEYEELNENMAYAQGIIPGVDKLSKNASSIISDQSQNLPVENDIIHLVSGSRQGELKEYYTGYQYEYFLNRLVKTVSDLSYNCHAFNSYKGHLNAIPDGIPVPGVLISGYGYRKSPFNGKLQFHRGIDLIARFKAPIKASGNGIVESAGTDRLWGKNVVIDHGYGIKTQYGHLNSINVEIGQKVTKGDLIGRLGQSGRATGPHLHYQIWIKGTPEDPLKFIAESEMKRINNVWAKTRKNPPGNLAMGGDSK